MSVLRSLYIPAMMSTSDEPTCPLSHLGSSSFGVLQEQTDDLPPILRWLHQCNYDGDTQLTFKNLYVCGHAYDEKRKPIIPHVEVHLSLS